MFLSTEGHPRDGLRLVLVDVDSGVSEMLTTQGCYWGANLSEDGSKLAFADCLGKRGRDRWSKIHLRDLTAGTDRVIGTVEGIVFGMEFSPGGQQVLVHRGGPRDLPDLVLGAEGKVEQLESGWLALGWAGRERILLGRGQETSKRYTLAVKDLHTGSLRELLSTHGFYGGTD